MVVFKNVTKTFGMIVALRDASFDIERGEFTFITGPSGAGKTTVLRLILREVMPNGGQVIVGGRNVATLKDSEIPSYRKTVGMVFQDFKLLSDRTIGENVALALSVSGIPAEKRLTRVKEVLGQVGLKDRADSFPSQLAGGELQRAVLARAIVNNPKIILADEPTGNLDPETGWEIVELLSGMRNLREGDTTVIMATHNRDIVDRMRSHVIELVRGKVVRDKKQGKYKDD